MKKKFIMVVLFSLLVLSLSIIPQFAMAIGNPDDPGGDPDAPIDGGVSILVAAGVAYGIKRIRDERNKKTDNLT